MTQAKPRFSSFEAYLSYDDGTDNRYELIDGELVPLPPESEPNNWIAHYLFLVLANARVVSPRLIRLEGCEIQVPVLQKGDAANRYPDLVILNEVHLALTQKRLTITADMPPPQLVVEVVSPGKTNRERDLIRKRAQYAARAIPEYWLVDRELESVTVLRLEGQAYLAAEFRGDEQLQSSILQELELTANQILKAE